MKPTKKVPVIIAESNFLTARLLSATLQGAGYPTAVARFGDEVLSLVEKHHADLLVIDMNLARPSGLELLRSLQQKGITLTILAGLTPGQSELRAAAAPLGVSEFFELPFLPQELAGRVAALRGDIPS